MKFREQNILLSDAVNDQSRILYDRTPRDRVEKVAPFLTLDGDPYPPSSTAGSCGSSTATRRPASTRTRSRSIARATPPRTRSPADTNVVALEAAAGQLHAQLGQGHRRRVRRHRHALRLGRAGPVLKAWKKIFPATVKPLSADQRRADVAPALPGGPVQGAAAAARPLPRDRRRRRSSAARTTGRCPPTRPSQPATAGLQPPYYLSLQMPDQDRRRVLADVGVHPADAAARSAERAHRLPGRGLPTPGSRPGQRRAGYGKLRLLQLPKDTVVPGPGAGAEQLQRRHRRQQPAQPPGGGQRATQVEYGNLLTLPLGGGLLYVQPVYVQRPGRAPFPLLQKVLVAFGDKIGFADTLQCALDQVFKAAAGATPAVHRRPGRHDDQDSGAGSDTTTSPSGSACDRRRDAAAPGNAAAAAQQALADASQAIDATARRRWRAATSRPTARPRTGSSAVTRALAARGSWARRPRAASAPRRAARRRRRRGSPARRPARRRAGSAAAAARICPAATAVGNAGESRRGVEQLGSSLGS